MRPGRSGRGEFWASAAPPAGGPAGPIPADAEARCGEGGIIMFIFKGGYVLGIAFGCLESLP